MPEAAAGNRRRPPADPGHGLPALTPGEIRSAVHDNLGRLQVERLDLVNLRVMDDSTPIAESFAVLAELREQGLIRDLGISNATSAHLAAARSVAPVACVQNLYNIDTRDDDALIDETDVRASPTCRSSRLADSSR